MKDIICWLKFQGAEENVFDPEIRDLWTPTAVLMGFQTLLIKWRLEHKQMNKQLVPSDYLNIAGILCFALGVVLLPASAIGGGKMARTAFGLGTLLFIAAPLGYAVALGFYSYFYRISSSSFQHVPDDQKQVVVVTTVIGILYLLISIFLP